MSFGYYAALNVLVTTPVIMAEHLIYLVSGTDVRHQPLSKIKQTAGLHDPEDSSE